MHSINFNSFRAVASFGHRVRFILRRNLSILCSR